jgi:hypothetical protein
LSSHLRLGPSSGLFSSDFPDIRAAWRAYLILLHLIALIIFGEVYRLWSSSLCSLLQPPA